MPIDTTTPAFLGSNGERSGPCTHCGHDYEEHRTNGGLCPVNEQARWTAAARNRTYGPTQQTDAGVTVGRRLTAIENVVERLAHDTNVALDRLESMVVNIASIADSGVSVAQLAADAHWSRPRAPFNPRAQPRPQPPQTRPPASAKHEAQWHASHLAPAGSTIIPPREQWQRLGPGTRDDLAQIAASFLDWHTTPAAPPPEQTTPGDVSKYYENTGLSPASDLSGPDALAVVYADSEE